MGLPAEYSQAVGIGKGTGAWIGIEIGIYLRNLTTFVVSTQDCDPAPPAHFERYNKTNCFNAIIPP
jgi:hypothetical protein